MITRVGDAAATGPLGGTMLRFYLPWIIEFALVVYCLIECIQTDAVLVRNLPKTTWVILIIFIPIAGSVAWLVAGRPVREQRRSGRAPWPSTATAGFPEYERPRPPRGPDDDPTFLSAMPGRDLEHEALLRQWEEQLRDKERRLREAETAADPPAEEPPPGEGRPAS